MEFNYQKAYFTLALPAFNNLNKRQKQAHKKIMELTKDLTQARDLNIPLNAEMEDILNGLTCLEVAEISNASYFIGNWKPSLTESIFSSEETPWKVSNVCDQILRKRLIFPHNVQIHEGKLRVTFSSKYCWTWEEFGLATQENLDIFKNCNLAFGENSLENSADKLKSICGDLWQDVEKVPDNKEYLVYKERQKEQKLIKLKEQQQQKLKMIKNDIKNSKIELKAFEWLVKNDINIDNCIFYRHKNIFCFGWRNPLSLGEREVLKNKLEGFEYKYEFK